MKVSIITATYNSEKTILDTLKSLNSQTYTDIEHIVIDGGSSDKTLEIVKSNSQYLSYLSSEKDNGIYDALNKGIEKATGDVIGFLHSDDLFKYPDVIKDIVETFDKYETEAVYSDLQYVSKDNIENIVRLWKSGDYCNSLLKKGWMPPHPTFYMKRECYQKMKGFDLDFKISADYESILRYLGKYNISMSYLPKVTISMRVGGESNRNLKNIVLKTEEDIKALKKNEISWQYAILMKNLSKIPQFIQRQ